mgnify:CR=1 FL=1
MSEYLGLVFLKVTGGKDYKAYLLKYNESEYKVTGTLLNNVSTDKLIKLKNDGVIELCNAVVSNDKISNIIRDIRYPDNFWKAVDVILPIIRKHILKLHNDTAGNCIEAAEYIAFIFTKLGLKTITEEGYCLYDCEDYGSDHPYDEHTWAFIKEKNIYLDVTLDQFNYGMYTENEYADIVVEMGLPHGIMREKPVEGKDYWIDW